MNSTAERPEAAFCGSILCDVDTKLAELASWTRENVKMLSINAEERIKETIFAEPKLVLDLWKEKSKLDEIFDSDNGSKYHEAREKCFPVNFDALFPSEARKKRWATTVDKLAEVAALTNSFVTVLLRNMQDSKRTVSYFMDLSGGAALWTKYVVTESRRLHQILRGSGSTSVSKITRSDEINSDLDIKQQFQNYGNPCNGKSLMHRLHGFIATKSPETMWFNNNQYEKPEVPRDFTRHWSWTVLHKEDVTTRDDVDECETLIKTHALMEIKKYRDNIEAFHRPRGVLLLLTTCCPTNFSKVGGEHRENLQEVYGGNKLVVQLHAMLRTLQPGGTFVCSLFGTSTTLTASVVFICCRLFESVQIVKPRRSRPVNSERFLVCGKLKVVSEEKEMLMRIIEEVLKKCEEHYSKEDSPESVVPIEWITNDKKFLHSFRATTEELCLRQTEALKKVHEAYSTGITTTKESLDDDDDDDD